MKRFINILLAFLFINFSVLAAGGWQLHGPKIQIVNTNGAPLTGGSLTFYECNTTTLKNTFPTKADAEASTNANTNPLSLNSLGQPSTNVFVTGCTKVVVKNSSGVVVNTEDNLYGLDDLSKDSIFLVEHNPDGTHIVTDSTTNSYVFPEFSAANQGVTGSSNTVKYYIDTIGTSNKTTIFLRHNSGSSETVYNFTTLTSVPQNYTFELENGAYINGLVTFQGSPEEQLKVLPGQRIFSSTSTILFLKGGKRTVNWWEKNAVPGTTDMTLAIQDAINASSSGVVEFLGEQYMHTGITILTDNIQLHGMGFSSTDLYCTANNAITLGNISTPIYYFKADNMKISNDSTSGSLITIPYGLIYAYIDVEFDQNDIDQNIIYSNGTFGIYESRFTGPLWDITSSHTVPGVYLVSNANVINENIFYPKRVHSHGANTFFFNITCTNGTTYNYHNVFRDITAEVVNGGLIKIAGGWGFSIQDIAIWDITTSTNDLILLTHDGTGGLNTYNTSIINVMRHGGTLGGGYYDINLPYAAGTLMINIQGSSAPSINANSTQALLFNSPSATVTNGIQTGKYAFDSISTRFITAETLAGTVASIKTGASSALTISGGVITPTQTLHTVLNEGAAASDNLDTITAGTEGDMFIFRPGNDAQTVVVKHGTGNIIIEGGADFSMDSAYDVAVFIYFAAKWLCIGKYNLGA